MANTCIRSDMREALRIHGCASSDSDSGKSDFDEEFYRNRPPPLKIHPSKIIVIRPVQTGSERELFIQQPATTSNTQRFNNDLSLTRGNVHMFSPQSENFSRIIHNSPRFNVRPTSIPYSIEEQKSSILKKHYQPIKSFVTDARKVREVNQNPEPRVTSPYSSKTTHLSKKQKSPSPLKRNQSIKSSDTIKVDEVVNRISTPHINSITKCDDTKCLGETDMAASKAKSQTNKASTSKQTTKVRQYKNISQGHSPIIHEQPTNVYTVPINSNSALLNVNKEKNVTEDNCWNCLLSCLCCCC